MSLQESAYPEDERIFNSFDQFIIRFFSYERIGINYFVFKSFKKYFMHENFISCMKKKFLCTKMKSLPQKFLNENSMHDIVYSHTSHEHFWDAKIIQRAKCSFACMEISLACMKMLFSSMEISNFHVRKYNVHAGNFLATPCSCRNLFPRWAGFRILNLRDCVRFRHVLFTHQTDTQLHKVLLDRGKRS